MESIMLCSGRDMYGIYCHISIIIIIKLALLLFQKELDEEEVTAKRDKLRLYRSFIDECENLKVSYDYKEAVSDIKTQDGLRNPNLLVILFYLL